MQDHAGIYIYIDRFIQFQYFSNEARRCVSTSGSTAAPRFAGKALSSPAGQCWAYRRGHAEKKVLGLLLKNHQIPSKKHQKYSIT
jgi:hypothetical protein